MIVLDAADQTGRCPVDRDDLTAAVQAGLAFADVTAASVTVIVLDDDALHAINRDHLGHDWPTDVVTFAFTDAGLGGGNGSGAIEGEIYVSLDTAAREAAERGRRVEDELTLYVVHGTLHLCGYDDHDDADRAAMRQAEREVLTQLGITPDRFE